MLRYVVRRLLLLVPILVGVSILIFFWIRALPGKPRRPRFSGNARRPSSSSSTRSGTASTSRFRSSTGSTSRRRCRAISGRASRRVGRSPSEIRLRISRDDRAGVGRDDLRRRRRHPVCASLPRSDTAECSTNLNPDRIAARDLDPDLLPGDHPEIPVRGAMALVTQRG